MASDGVLQLLLGGDERLFAVVRLSLVVSLSAVALAALVGLPLGALLALARFPGRQAAVVAVNALMGLPPVVVGLTVFLLLSRAGPLGALGWLFTPRAMPSRSAWVLPSAMSRPWTVMSPPRRRSTRICTSLPIDRGGSFLAYRPPWCRPSRTPSR